MNRYRVLSVQFLDVYAKDEDDAISVATQVYQDMDADSKDSVRAIVTSYDYDDGISIDQLVSIGLFLGSDDVPFVLAHDPF